MQDLQMYTYTAPSYKETMEIAKNKHGEDALIVSSKEIRKKSLLENGLWEIVVVAPKQDNKDKNDDTNDDTNDDLPDNSVEKRLQNIAKKAIEKKKEAKERQSSDIGIQISNAVKEIAKLTPNTSKRGIETRENISENSKKSTKDNIDKTREEVAKRNQDEAKDLKNIRQELDKINDKMKLIQSMFWDDISQRAQNTNNIPHEFAEIYRICKNSGMKNEHLEEIMQLSQNLMPVNMRENSVTIKRYFREVLRKMIACRPENIDMKRKRIVMLVGPTGVGKTTTLAKLATHYSVKHRYKVGLITLDSYRIGAYDQLAFYAKKLKLSINAVNDTTEFTKSLDELKYCDYILIDTIGSSQHDKQKLDILKKYVNADYNIDVNLVLCATTKYEDLMDIYYSFGSLNIDTLIFSKLDESKGFGNLFSLIYDTKKPVSYFTIGQEVPEDILAARNDYLADCIINGFSKPSRDEILR
ncbi:flagellar biosynthesis protein FlhF [Helicobacter sp. MIT 99-5507]|uniref:flagellar biosynthesis protein FlhF n=1 Tax=Helicobacter sp. MIT 99-5507 TaxID=152489 RepID=UPI000E1EB6A5|nr:flagellar biosynthesis protein FlhF [Helicobacter sp. MIT 99-5507]RDU56546.1 flagellar biosynthesis protein FlhF [Helicobacter sp. MIT 99-5507]